jgi:hypothetical protein
MRPLCPVVVFIDAVPDGDAVEPDDELAEGLGVVAPLGDDELLMMPPGVVPDGLAPVAVEPDELAPAAPPAAPPPLPAASAKPELPASNAAANAAMNGFECGMVVS